MAQIVANEKVLDIGTDLSNVQAQLEQAQKLSKKSKKGKENAHLLTEALSNLQQAKTASEDANNGINEVIENVSTDAPKTREELRAALRQKMYTGRVQRMGKYGQKTMMSKMSEKMEEEKAAQQEQAAAKAKALADKKKELQALHAKMKAEKQTAQAAQTEEGCEKEETGESSPENISRCESTHV